MMKYYSKEDEQRILSNPDHFYQCLDLDIDIELEKTVVINGISQKVSIKGHFAYPYQNLDQRNLPLIGIGLRNTKRNMIRCLEEALDSHGTDKAPDCNDKCYNGNQPLELLTK